VSNLVQEDLLNFLYVAIFNQVTTDGDSSGPEITLSSSVNCPVETEGEIDEPVLDKELMGQVKSLQMGCPM
jgi:hypothetical protein